MLIWKPLNQDMFHTKHDPDRTAFRSGSPSPQIDLDKGHDPDKAHNDPDRGLIRIEASDPDRGPI